MPLDLTKLTMPKVASILRGARIVSAVPIMNGVALEIEMPDEQHVAVSFSLVITPHGPDINANVQEL